MAIGILILLAVAIGYLMVAERQAMQGEPAWPIAGGAEPPMPPPAPAPVPFTPISALAPVPQLLPGGHNEWDNQVRYACLRFGMTDPMALLFVKAVIQRESSWRVNARGDYDASRCPDPYRGDAYYAGYCSIGLGQIHRYWQPDLAANGDLRDGNWNIVATCKVLSQGYHRWWPDWQRVYAQYNAGGAAAEAWPNVSAQVQHNVAAVGSIYHSYALQAGVAV